MARRNTVQQKAVACQLSKLHGSHPTADEVYSAVSAEYPTVSKATVYRVLNRMAEEGTALKVNVSDGPDRFDDTLQAHYHVLCTRCGRVDDVEVSPAVGSLDLDAAAKAAGYTITGHDLLFRGVCPNCKKGGSQDE